MMRIGVGALVGIMGGPATYAIELVRALARRGGHEYVAFTDRPEAFATSGVETVHVPLTSTYQQVLWDHVRLPGLLQRSGVALFHATKGVRPFRCPVPCVLTVHDLAVYTHPETFAWPQRWHFRACVPPSVVRAARVIADSAHARADLIARFALPPERVRAVPLGVDDRFRTPPSAAAIAGWRTRHGLGSALVASVGTVQPRKRVERVIEAFVRTGAVERGWQLVIAGRVRPGYRPSWSESPPPGVCWLGPVDDESLRALYASASVFVSASEYEGFGLTVCEAMASGAAVVAVATSSIPEVVGDAGILVERSDSGLLATALGRLLDDAAVRDSMAARARERAAAFTWQATAAGTVRVYEEALGV